MKEKKILPQKTVEEKKERAEKDSNEKQEQ